MRPDTWPLFVNPNVLRFFGEGLLLTLQMSVYAIGLSFTFALLLALARNARAPILSWPATVYIEGIRSLPVLLMIIVVNFQAAKALRPFLGEDFDISPFWAGVVGLTIYTSAVLAEIIRAGITSLPRGQWEAARALGLRYHQLIGYVVLPQALRRMVPAIVAQFTTLIKDSSLAYAIAVQELLSRGRVFYAQYFNPVDTLIVICVIYFVINYALSLASRRLEMGRLPQQARSIALRDQAA
jgi:aspartate/glutamate/glutamine transport system permease protein